MLLTIFVFILVLSILVFIHELGHFLTAKYFGMKVEEFGLGLPPKVFGKKIGETFYSLNLLPIGGFVKLAGEEENEEEKIPEKEKNLYFYNFPKWKRAVVLSAGVVMNFILAVTVISYIFTQGITMPTQRVRIEKVLSSSPAQRAGLSKNDIIIAINNQKISTPDDLISITQKNLDKEILMEVNKFSDNAGKSLIVKIIPRAKYPQNEGPMGVVITNLEEKKYSWYLAPFYGLKETLNLTLLLVKGIGGLLFKVFTFSELPKDVAGPIGIAQLTGQAVKFGWMAVLQLLGLLSLNLAVVNILPIPALDGGRLAFVFLEKIIGRKVRAKIEMRTHQVGMIFLLSLMVLVTIADLIRFFTDKGWFKF